MAAMLFFFRAALFFWLPHTFAMHQMQPKARSESV